MSGCCGRQTWKQPSHLHSARPPAGLVTQPVCHCTNSHASARLKIPQLCSPCPCRASLWWTRGPERTSCPWSPPWHREGWLGPRRSPPVDRSWVWPAPVEVEMWVRKSFRNIHEDLQATANHKTQRLTFTVLASLLVKNNSPPSKSSFRYRIPLW